MTHCSYKMQPANFSFTTIKIELYRTFVIIWQFKIFISFLMIVFALCLATFELFKQTDSGVLTRLLSTPYIHLVLCQTSVATLQHTSIRNDWHHTLHPSYEKTYTMNIHGRMQIYTAAD